MQADHGINCLKRRKNAEIKTALVIVDVQNDFITGTLKVDDGEDIVPVINSLLSEQHFDYIVYSLDWHPPHHVSFIENETNEHQVSLTSLCSCNVIYSSCNVLFENYLQYEVCVITCVITRNFTRNYRQVW